MIDLLLCKMVILPCVHSARCMTFKGSLQQHAAANEHVQASKMTGLAL